MRTIFILLLCGIINVSSYAQPGFDSVYQYSPDYADAFYSLAIDNDTLAVMRPFYDTINKKWGLNFLKLDTFGSILFSNILSDTIGFHGVGLYGNKLIMTSDNGYAFAGSYAFNPDCEGCIFLAKFKHSGELDFIKYHHPPDSINTFFVAPNLVQLDDGGYMIFGQYQISGVGTDIPHIIRTDPYGNELWSREYPATGDTSIVFYDANKVSSNKIVLTGSKFHYAPAYVLTYIKSYLLIIDSLGNTIQEQLGESDSIVTNVSLQTLDNGYIQSVQRATKFDDYSSIGGIRKLDSNLVEEWVRYVDYPSIYGGISYQNIVRTSDGHYVAAGARGYAGTDKPAMHIKISKEGEVLWERFDFSHYGTETGIKTRTRATSVLSSGSIVSVGSTWINEPNSYSEKGWLIKISPGGCIDDTDTLDCWAGATVVSTLHPPKTNEIQVYPNPANDELTVSLPNTKYKDLTIEFYDITGRFLRKQQLIQGNNHLTISNLPKGMLFYTILSEKGILMNGKLVKE